MDSQCCQAFCATHQLPPAYVECFLPLMEPVIADNRTLLESKAPVIFGINGCQGSGKSTLATFLSCLLEEAGLRSVVLSIDDFYLTLEARQNLAREIHPLLLTRGVPGTHDISLAVTLFEKLASRSASTVAVPRYDKGNDDRFPLSEWDRVDTPLDVVIFEGWCVGAKSQPRKSLVQPVNTLEKEKDPDGRWREYVNEQLDTVYQQWFSRIDRLLMLEAPGFETVFDWRMEQEQKLSAANPGASKLMDGPTVRQFVASFQRLTEWMLLSMPSQVDYCFTLDERREVTRARY